VALARVREAELVHRWDPQRYPAPNGGPTAGQLKGIAVRSA
jgi:indolepyruvate ferredoxin oxidoreductase